MSNIHLLLAWKGGIKGKVVLCGVLNEKWRSEMWLCWIKVKYNACWVFKVGETYHNIETLSIGKGKPLHHAHCARNVSLLWRSLKSPFETVWYNIRHLKAPFFMSVYTVWAVSFSSNIFISLLTGDGLWNIIIKLKSANVWRIQKYFCAMVEICHLVSITFCRTLSKTVALMCNSLTPNDVCY